MQYTTVVKVVEEGSNRPLAGVQVALFDRDTFSRDDKLGLGTTDAGGEIRFDYRSEDFVDLDDRIGGIFPELYAVVYRPDGGEMHSTKADAVDNTPRKFITVTVPASAAQAGSPAA
jgi:hypothetical protein